MTVLAVTAEWTCPRCGATNRKLVAADTRGTTDRCVHCRLVCTVTPGAHPSVRWNAAPKK